MVPGCRTDKIARVTRSFPDLIEREDLLFIVEIVKVFVDFEGFPEQSVGINVD